MVLTNLLRNSDRMGLQQNARPQCPKISGANGVSVICWANVPVSVLG